MLARGTSRFLACDVFISREFGYYLFYRVVLEQERIDILALWHSSRHGTPSAADKLFVRASSLVQLMKDLGDLSD